MIDSLKNIFSIPELRKRVLFTFMLLAVYRIGAQIPTPGVNGKALAAWSRPRWHPRYFDLFTGQGFSNFTVFALGIMPYISASIILQLLTVVVPFLEKLSKEGEMGRRKITQYTRYGTVLLSIVQGMGISLFLENSPSPVGGEPIVAHPGWFFRFMVVVTLTTGTAFIMWLGEQITERGIGNGISLIIFAGIVVGLVPGAMGLARKVVDGDMSLITIALLLVFMVFVCMIIVFVERGQRRFPVQHAKRVNGRKVYGGQLTHLPLKVNTGGVIPVIFASSLILIPQTLANLLKTWEGVFGQFAQNLYDRFPGYPTTSSTSPALSSLLLLHLHNFQPQRCG